MIEVKFPNGYKQYIKLISASKTIVGKKVMEYVQNKWVIIEWNKIEEDDTYSLLYKHIEQNVQGTSFIHKWMGDLEKIYEEVEFKVNKKGEILDIINLYNLQRVFSNLLPYLRKSYPNSFLDLMIPQTSRLLKEKELLMKSFVGYSTWRFFFQNLFKLYDTQEQEGFILEGYFNKIDLPLLLNKKIESSQDSTEELIIKQTAQLNKSQFKQNEFSRMLKDLTGLYDVKTKLNVEMEEIYRLKKDGLFSTCDMFLETKVANWYSITSAHQLISLTEDEFNNEVSTLSEMRNKQKNRPSRFLDEDKMDKSFFLEEKPPKF